MEEILLEFLSKTLNIDKDGVAELLKSDEGKIKENALDLLLDKDKGRIKELREKYFNDGHKKAVKETRQQFEKEIKEKFELDSDAQGIELIELLIEKQKPSDDKDKKKKEEITWEDIKKRPEFIEFEKKVKKEFEDKQKEFEDQLKAKELEFKKKETLTEVEKRIHQIIEDVKPALSSDPQKAANQKKVIIDALTKNNFEIQGDQIILLKEDGSRLEDEHGHIIDFNVKVKETISSYFDIPVATDRSSAGNGKERDSDRKETKPLVMPKTKEEYIQTLTDSTIPLADRLKIKEEFNKLQTAK
jgi:hypothetical protein